MAAVTEASTHAHPKIQLVNIANVVAYLVNLVVTYGVMASDRFPDNAEVSEKYQTLVTPAGYAFGIWGIIFTSQLVWTVVQLLPSYRANALVVRGVGFYYVPVCIAQAAWTFCFTAERIILSTVAMVCILIPLFIITNNITHIAHRSVKDFWLLKFPFLTHFAWVFAATFVNINVLLIAENTSANVQFYSAVASLVALAVVACYYAVQRVYVIPAVVVWASYAIRIALVNASTSMVLFHGTKHINMIKDGSGALATIAAAVLIASALREKCGPATHFGHTQGSSAEYTQLSG